MLDVYKASPEVLDTQGVSHKLFGDVVATEQTEAIEGVDLDSNYCWEQSATNESMRAALGLHSGMYTGTDNVAGVAAFATGKIVDRYVSSLNFPIGNKGRYEDEPTKARVRDRDAFQKRISKLTVRRIVELKEIYAANAAASPNGTQSSRGCRNVANCPPLGQPLTAGQRIDFLNVPPIRPPKLDEPLTQVTYLDRPVTDATDPASTLDNAMARVFWRSNLDHTCRESIRNDAQVLNDLREACISAADGSGDPDACTECTHRAEALIPQCNFESQSNVRDSRCSALGTVENAAPPAGLPGYWFSNAQRWRPPPEARELTTTNLCAPPFHVAMSWCTGTVLRFKQSHERMSAEVQPMDVENSVTCRDGTGPEFTRDFGTGHFRRGTIIVEPAARVSTEFAWYEYQPGPWLPPMVNAYYEAETNEAGSDPCHGPDIVSYSTDSVLQRNIGTAKLDEFRDFYYPSPRMPWCGHLQRVSQWGGQPTASRPRRRLATADEESISFGPTRASSSVREKAAMGRPASSLSRGASNARVLMRLQLATRVGAVRPMVPCQPCVRSAPLTRPLRRDAGSARDVLS